MDFLDLHPFVRQTARDKALGAIIGAALGDAIGLYTEFLPKTACLNAYPSLKFTLLEPRTPFREDTHRDKFEPGDWTDDTDQSLLIILSYLHNFKSSASDEVVVDAKDIAVRIHDWIIQGLRCLDRPPLGIGQTIGKVVLDPGYLSDPEGTALKVWVKSKRNAAPNGSLMRTHPLGVMCVGKSLEETFEVAAAVGRVTHVDPRCVVSCCLATALVRGLIRGDILDEADVDELIGKAFEWVNAREELRNPEFEETEGENAKTNDTGEPAEETRLDIEEYRKHTHANTLQDLQLDDSQKMGYVYKCLGTAILSLRLAMRKQSESNFEPLSTFETFISRLIMEGGDADTNACVAGALLGAYVGHSRLPQHWEQGIRNRNWLLLKAQAVVLRCGISKHREASGSKTLDVDPDTAIDGGKEPLSKRELDIRERDFVMMILMKQKHRRDVLEEEEKARKGGIAKWFKRS